MDARQKIIAIDFGSTKIVSAYYSPTNRIASIIVDPEENRIMLNCVAFTESQRLFGFTAENQASVNAMNTIRGTGEYMQRIRSINSKKISTFYKPFRSEITFDSSSCTTRQSS